jgi:hypothetical protein
VVVVSIWSDITLLVESDWKHKKVSVKKILNEYSEQGEYRIDTYDKEGYVEISISICEFGDAAIEIFKYLVKEMRKRGVVFKDARITRLHLD